MQVSNLPLIVNVIKLHCSLMQPHSRIHDSFMDVIQMQLGDEILSGERGCLGGVDEGEIAKHWTKYAIAFSITKGWARNC